MNRRVSHNTLPSPWHLATSQSKPAGSHFTSMCLLSIIANAAYFVIKGFFKV